MHPIPVTPPCRGARVPAIAVVIPTAMAPAIASADVLEAWLDAQAECVQTLAAFNDDRPWLQLRLEGERATVLVESGAQDGVAVALSCSARGLAEGRTYAVPAVISGGRELPDERLPRARYDRAHLAELLETGRRLTGLRVQVPAALVVTAVVQPRDTVLTTVTFGAPGFRTVTFDAEGREVADPVPDLADWEPPPAADERPSLGVETPIRSLAEVTRWLAGAIGAATPVHRFIVDQGMVTVAYDDPAAGYVMQQWHVQDGNLGPIGAPSPVDAGLAGLYVRCTLPPRASGLSGAYAKLAPRLGRRLDAALMLTLECRNEARKPTWELLGGDGALNEGQALEQRSYPFER